MRNISLAVRVAVFVAVFSVAAVGQQPTHAVLLHPSTSIDLPVEPVRLEATMTLGDAAKHNDFPMFEAMFNAASQREAAPFRELHTFWKWSLTDPVGAFYGDETHARLAAEYPDYADYIADYGIIDAHRNAYYPSAETRQFLLKHALSARTAVVAEEKRPDGERTATTAKPRTAVVTRSAERKVIIRHATVRPVVAESNRQTVRAVAITAKRPTVVSAAPVLQTAPAVTVHAVAPNAAVRSTVTTAAPPRVAAVTVRRAPAKVATVNSDGRLGRGLLLIIAGLVGLGLLTLMLNAPGEDEVAGAAAERHPLEPARMVRVQEQPKKTA